MVLRNTFSVHLCDLVVVVSCSGSARRAETAGTTVTPTLPAQWTQKTSGASSMTVAISFSGCIYGSTSCCDGPRSSPQCLPTASSLPHLLRTTSSASHPATARHTAPVLKCSRQGEALFFKANFDF